MGGSPAGGASPAVGRSPRRRTRRGGFGKGVGGGGGGYGAKVLGIEREGGVHNYDGGTSEHSRSEKNDVSVWVHMME